MAKKGFIIVEGARAFCSSAQVIKNAGRAVPMKVTSQKKKLGKNKYFAQEKPIATFLDDKAENFNNGQAFVMCQDPKNTSTGYSPCAAKCNIKYKDYYENVEFNKSMKILLDASTGTCQGYGIPGTIQFASTGQTNNVSQIDVKEADAFSVQNTSPQWESAASTSTSTTSVSTISMTGPLVANKISGVYYYIASTNNKVWNIGLGTGFLNNNLTLNAQFKGDASKIIWTLFKGEDAKDKVKTFIGLGNTFNQPLDKIFENLPEGKYRIEAYGKKAGDKNCAIIIEVIKDFVKKITPAGTSSLVNIPIPVSVEYKISVLSNNSNLLNRNNFNVFTNNMPLYWRIKQGNTILYNSHSGTNSPHLVNVLKTASSATITFKNAGKYTVEAFTDVTDPNPVSVELKIESSLGIMGVTGGSGLLRNKDNLKVQVSQYNVTYLPNVKKQVHWYLKKEGQGRITTFEKAASATSLQINKIVSQFLSEEAHVADVFGKYILEAYANPLQQGKQPAFSGADCYRFEVIKNAIDQFTLPASIIPKGAKVKYNAVARISPLTSNELITLEIPPNVTMDGTEKTLTFNELGEYTITAYLTGEYTENKKIEAKIKVANPKVKKALWSYENGIKRTLSGYEEESYGFVEIEGLLNQPLKVKIWVKGEGDDFYKDKEKYLLEEKTLSLNAEGKASFKITTDKAYKEKLEKAIPKTIDNPNPVYQLVFTIELQAGTSTNVILPSSISIDGTRSVVIDNSTTYLEVLEANESLNLTSEKKIISLMFATEYGKDIQRTQTFYGKTHKIWVHTVNMTEETLKVDVFKEVPKQSLSESNHIIYTHESKESFKEEKVGKDGLLEVSFTVKPDWKNPPKNFDYYIAQVARLMEDPVDKTKNIWKPEKIQLTINNTLPVDLVRTEDMEKLGIKAYKQDGTAFTQDEMLELRKQFIFYESGALKVSQLETPEAIENEVMPVVVEMAEVKKQKTCWCDKPFHETDVRSLVTHMRGKEEIWENTHMDRESFADLTLELNAMFSKYSINKCIQKIAFLANVHSETSFFRIAGEEKSEHASSGYKYKGRGIQQLTGDGSNPVAYGVYDQKVPEDIVAHPELIAIKLHLAVDSGGWFWSEYKKVSEFKDNKKYSNEEKASMKFKKEYFSKALGKSLNDTALLMEDEEEKYYFLICKMLNGYSPIHRLEVKPNGWEARKEGLAKLKEWFKYDKNVCDHTEVLPNLTGRAPWMDIAISEAKIYGGKEEDSIDSRIKVYHKEGGGTDAGSGTAWCASFVCWCLEQKDYPSPHSAGSRMFLTSSNAEKCEVFYGAVAVFSDCDSTGTNIYTTGHCTFVFGKLLGNELYACLGGNQGDMLKMSRYDCSGNVFVSWTQKNGTKHYKIFRGFYKPKGYVIKDNEKLTSNDNYTSADNASKTALNLNIQSNENGESSR